MATARTAWGIDIGQCAIKAVKLARAEEGLTVEAFDVIEHPQILSEEEADRRLLIRAGLDQFLSRNSIAGSTIAVAVPGQSSFTRFVKLPPVEPKRIPDIVRFEAEQQIPFPIEEVLWRWQTFHDPDSPDVEVGLFAMKRTDVAEMLGYFEEVAMPVDVVQMAPLALYNFMTFDEQLATEEATLLVDVGADKTDLVVADGGRIWTRTIQIGGTSFTQAIERAFKLRFAKADKLKRSAATSKYARQIFQSMRPVFSDLVQEIQRSVGYYASLHRDTRFKRLVGLGNGFRLPGLQKFIEQNLNISVVRIDSFNQIAPSGAVTAPAFQENVLSFAVAYGLAIQGMEQAEVDTNLLPGEILRDRLWKKKRPWFVAAALALVAALFCPGWRARQDSQTLADATGMQSARRIADTLKKRVDKWKELQGQGKGEERKITQLAHLFAYRDFWPSAMTLINRSIEAVATDQRKMPAYARYLALRQPPDPERIYAKIIAGADVRVPSELVDKAAEILLDDGERLEMARQIAGGTQASWKALSEKLATAFGDANALPDLKGEELKGLAKRLILRDKIRQAEAFKASPRNTRRVIFIKNLSARYLSALPPEALKKAQKADPPLKGSPPGFQIVMDARTTLLEEQANALVSDLRLYSVEFSRWLDSVAVVDHAIDWPPGGGTEVMQRDPFMAADAQDETENMAADTNFKITWWVAITSNGIVMADVKVGSRYELSREIGLLPDLEPADTFEQIKAQKEKIVKAPVGATITIEESQTKWTTPWFRVRAADPEGKALGAGWVSGAALSDDVLEEVTQTP